MTIKHGLSRTPEYRAWQMMRLRCTNPKNAAWPNYGGRGITVCDRWLNSVAAFVADMGLKPSPHHELDRIDNDRGYEPSNCRWATRSENDRNRRSTVWVDYQGERVRLIELLERHGIPGDTYAKRIGLGWSMKRALTTPVRSKRPNGLGPPPKQRMKPRLADEQKREIHALYAAGGHSHSSLARLFDRSDALIGLIVNDPRWAGPTDPQSLTRTRPRADTPARPRPPARATPTAPLFAGSNAAK